MGGIGKTTLAETLFHRLSSKFEASCFLRNVREREQKDGLEKLQNTLLSEILKEEILSIGATYVRGRLSRTKVLIVLDDVSDSMQLERLAGDRLPYGTGSRIIITTRDRGTLGPTVKGDNIYKVEGLQLDDALQLLCSCAFCSRAFKNNSTRRTDYKELAEKVVHYARGVPLALTVLGSLFCNCKSKEEWEDLFNKLKRFPNEDIQKVLRISYDRLGRNEKEIFLDIACFCNGWPVDRVKRMLNVRGFFATIGIGILIDRSLISIDSNWGSESIEMHDLLQEMGRTIVQEQYIKDPGKQSRLFTAEDIYHVLKSNTETTNVEAIRVNWYNLQKRPLKRANFKKMSNLIMLITSSYGKLTTSLDLPDSLRYLEWCYCPLESLPSNFCPENLVELHMPDSKVKKLWKEEQILVNLQVIDLSYSEYLTEVPNLSGSPKIVKINFGGCRSLVEIPSYFQHLYKLTHLDLKACSSLKYLPEMPGNLTYLCLQATGIKELPESVWSNENISYLDLKGFVGIESHIEQVESLLGIHSPDACITIGIWGMGGIGKTTLAETVFHKLSSKFEASCFVENVRENSEKPNGLDHLVKTLLKEILKEENLSIESTFVQDRLRRTKVLIVLDDVSNSSQMERLAGNRLRYGSGSRIIITSRDRSTLGQTVEEDKIYEVQGLQPDDAVQLFCSRAFKDNSTRRTDYKELVEKAVHYAGRVPLALVVLGSLFFNFKSKEEWEEEFNKLKRFPSDYIQTVLRISYDGLDKNEKDIFLDIACFHKGKNVDLVKRRLASCERFPKTGINILINRCLISIGSSWGSKSIEMHDLLQEMGKTIVQEQCINDPGKWSRLFNNEDVYRVLKSNTETPNVEAIHVDWCYLKERPLKRADFKKMSNLIMLIVDDGFGFTASLDLPDSLRYLSWRGYPLESLPSNFCPENLVELHMPYSKVKKLCKEEQMLVNLQVINLSHSRLLTEIPECFQHLRKLTHLELGCCMSLKYLPEMPGTLQYLDLQESGVKELPESVWSNENISYLNISRCYNLEKLPSNTCELKVSNVLGIESCKSLGEFSELPRDINKLSLVDCNRLVSLPTDICKLKYLEELNLSGCARLVEIPWYFQHLHKLTHLRLGRCTSLKYLPEMPGSIEYLDLHSSGIEELPESQHLHKLTHLCLGYCISLKYLPEMPGSIKYIDLSHSGIKELPESVWSNENISYLNINHCKDLEKLPSNRCKLKASGCFNLNGCTSLGELSELPRCITTGSLVDCKRLVSLPTNICKLKYLEKLDLSGCSELENFPEILEPMEHLKYLNLSGTAVKELPSSIEFLPALKSIQLEDCYRLSSIPKSICKLKYLEELDLSGCFELENFPEILEPMEHLKSLNLSRTAVEQLYTSSIEFLPALKKIELEGCNKLSCISKSLLKYVKRPDEYETSESDDHGSEASEIEDDSDLSIVIQ